MSSAQRALVGALLGALIVLLLHPSARPFLLQGAIHFGPSVGLRQSTALPENLATLPDPQSPQTGALTLLVAAERINSNQTLTQDQVLLMIEICQAAGEAEPDNAFWRQMESVFQSLQENEEAAKRAWARGSLAQDYNDYQVARLQSVVTSLARDANGDFAWHTGVALSKKSTAAAALISGHAQKLVTEFRQSQDMRMLSSTVRNGRLLRDGARAVPAAELGSKIINIVPGGTLMTPASPRQSVENRNAFLTKLSRQGLTQEYEVSSDAFTSDDAWHALIPNTASVFRRDTLRHSVASATFPGAMILAGFASAVVAMIGSMIGKRPDFQKFIQKWLPTLGIVLGVAVYFLTGLVFPAIWTTIVLAGFAVAPKRLLPTVPKRLGIGFDLSQSILSGMGACFLVAYFMTSSMAASTLADALQLPSSLKPASPVMLAWALLSVSFSLATSQVWAFLNNRRSAPVAGIGLVRFGATAAVACIIIGIASTPLMIAWDNELSETLTRLFRNEPGYYFNRNPS